MDRYSTYSFRPYRLHLGFAIFYSLGFFLLLYACVHWTDGRDRLLMIALCCFTLCLIICAVLGYRAQVLVSSDRIIIKNDGKQRSIVKRLNQYDTMYFVGDWGGHTHLILTNTNADPACLRSIANRNGWGVFLHVKEHIDISVFPSDIERITTIVGDMIKIVHL